MKKEVFLKELEYLLLDLPCEEQKEALAYFRDYLGEADDEEEAVRRLGSPEKVAAQIKAGLSDETGGEFTERGYQDGHFREDYQVPDQYAEMAVSGKDSGKEASDGNGCEEKQESGFADGADPEGCCWDSFAREGKSCREEWSKWRREKEQRYESRWEGTCREKENRQEKEAPRWWEYKEPKKERGSFFLFLCLLIFGLLAAKALLEAGFSVLGGILGVVFGILGSVFGLIFAALMGAIAAAGTGIGLIGAGIANLSSPAVGTMLIAGGFFLLAAAVLLLLLAGWGCSTAVPWMIRLVRNAARAVGLWLGRIFDSQRRMRGDSV